MSHPLQNRLAQVRRRVSRLLTLYGASRFVLAVLAVMLACMLVDYGIGWRDRGVRWLISLVALGAAGWAVARFLVPVWRARFRDVDLALRLESLFPALRGKLASAVEFLSQSEDDPLAGSPALRRAVIHDATAATQSLDVSRVVQPRPVVASALQALGLGLVAVVLVLLDPGRAGIAVARLVAPWRETPWPQVHHLVIEQPVHRLALGETFEVEVRDLEGAAWPDDARIHYRFAADETPQVEPLVRLDGKLLARREQVVRPFDYGVSGGDAPRSNGFRWTWSSRRRSRRWLWNWFTPPTRAGRGKLAASGFGPWWAHTWESPCGPASRSWAR